VINDYLIVKSVEVNYRIILIIISSLTVLV